MPKIIENPTETILNHARDIIINEGYDSLNMRKISKATGIAVGTIYNYFPAKEDLILELMENYWQDYLKAIDKIDKTESDFFSKLRLIFEKLDDFLQTFLKEWVRNSASKYTEDGLTRKKSFTEKLNKKLEAILIEAEASGKITLFLDPYTIAKFLILNFIMMTQMKQFDYSDFEIIIKKLLI